MAQVIEFYVPVNHPFHRGWTRADERSKIIKFPGLRLNSATIGDWWIPAWVSLLPPISNPATNLL